MNADSLPEHLLEQALHLANRERKRPRQASLRRATSTAYYALFHLLVRDAMRQIGPNLDEGLYNRAYRWFDHGTMYKVAKAFSESDVRAVNTKDILLKNSGWMELIAELFVNLQELRHSADYDPGAVFIRAEVLEYLSFLHVVFDQWPSLRNTPECNAFLLSLLLWEKWSKQR